MHAKSEANKANSFSTERTFDAPRELVWKAFTEAERLAKWWGPKGFGMVVAKLDLRPGGTFLYGMKAPDGNMMWGKFVYREIIPPERMDFVVSFTDEHGTPTRHPLSATWPLEVFNTATFSEHEGKTTVSMTGYPINASAEEIETFAAGRESMNKGFAGTLDQLEAYLASCK